MSPTTDAWCLPPSFDLRLRRVALVALVGIVSIAVGACAGPSATGAATAPTSASRPAPARPLVQAALEAMGGEARVRAIKTVHMKTVGTWMSVEASERPEPPWNVNYDKTEEWLDFERAAWRQDTEFLSLSRDGVGEWQPFGLVVADGVAAMRMGGPLKVGGPVFLGDAEERLLYQPYRLLLAALDAADLSSEGGATLAGQPVEVVAFHHAGMPVRLWIDARTRRLASAEVVHSMPNDYFWRVRGDVRDRLEFSQWSLHSSGVWFARQCDLNRAGIPYHSFLATLIEPNAAPPETFGIPDDVRASFKTTSRGPASTPAAGETPVSELAPGVFLAGARWSSLLVDQPGGALLVDAPISDVYFGRELDLAARRFGKPAATVILSDHVIPQLEGVREAAARGVTIRTLDANRSFVASLLVAPHTLAPDALQRSSRAAKLEGIASRTTLGDGPTQVELVPMRGTLGERVLLVWLPAPRLLWVASALALDADGRASPSRLAELDAVVAREHLDVRDVVGATLKPTSWASLHAHAAAR